MKELFKNEYLNQKLEPIAEILEGVKVADYDEFGEHSYEAEAGNFEFIFGDTKISLKYSKPGYENIMKQKHLPASLFRQALTNFEDLADPEKAMEIAGKVIDGTRIIEEFTLEKNNERYSFAEILSEGRIYFNSQGDPSSSGFQPETSNIFLAKDPLTPEGLVTLFHEMGHYEDITTGDEDAQWLVKSESKISTIFQAGGEKAIAFNTKLKGEKWEMGAGFLLARERAAWAFALKNIKPFIKDLGIKSEKLEQEIHGKCLQSYSTFIRNVIE
jgi:hypothetical protein